MSTVRIQLRGTFPAGFAMISASRPWVLAPLIGGLSLLMCGPKAFAAWSGGTVHKDERKAPLACGGVTGEVGALSPFTTPATGGNAMTTTGEVGAKWNGEQYNHADDSDNESPFLMHSYSRESSGPATITVSLTETVTITGSSHRLVQSDQQWWWDSVNSVMSGLPAAQTYVPGQGTTNLTLTWSSSTYANATGGDAGTQHPAPGQPPSSNNNNATTPPSSTSQFTGNPITNGTCVGTAQLPDVAGATVDAYTNWVCIAQGCVDNAAVSNDKLKDAFTFSTSIN